MITPDYSANENLNPHPKLKNNFLPKLTLYEVKTFDQDTT